MKGKGKFSRFWNRLFTYAYDCDNGKTFFVNETFFISCALVLAWFCTLALDIPSRIVGWTALVILCIGEAYLLISFYLAITTLAYTKFHRNRVQREAAEASASSGGKNGKKQREPVRKPQNRRNYRINNKRL